MTRPSEGLPEVTEAHRRAAFEAMHWADWTYEQAMADDTRSRVIEVRAHQIRTSAVCGRAWVPTPSAAAPRPAAPQQQVQKPSVIRAPIAGVVDRKRAAAGDRDD